jgi:hypothetical protein
MRPDDVHHITLIFGSSSRAGDKATRRARGRRRPARHAGGRPRPVRPICSRQPQGILFEIAKHRPGSRSMRTPVRYAAAGSGSASAPIRRSARL